MFQIRDFSLQPNSPNVFYRPLPLRSSASSPCLLAAALAEVEARGGGSLIRLDLGIVIRLILLCRQFPPSFPDAASPPQTRDD